jgi:hypothetical protein
VFIQKKGETYYDYCTEKELILPNAGIAVYFFEKAGGTYVYKNGKFVANATSD